MADLKGYQYNAVGIPTEREEQLIADILRDFSQLNQWRNTTAAQWEEISELIDPPSRNTFYYGDYNFPGIKKTDRQVDASGMLALDRFAAIMNSLLTPANQRWHGLMSIDPDLMKVKEVRQWYEDSTRLLFQYRMDAFANWASQNQTYYHSLGAYGTGTMFIDQGYNAWNNPIQKLRYRLCPAGEIFIKENHQGIVDTVFRWFRLTARQARQFFGDKLPPTLQPSYEQRSETLFNFLHCVYPRADYEPGRLDAKGKPYVSYYVSVEGKCLVGEGGYRSFPFAVGRYKQTPWEVYGRGPASYVLPALKTLNAQKTTFLKVGHRAADPVLLTMDDGLVDPSLRPGAVNKGGMNKDGKPLIGVLPTGQIQVTLEMMQEEKALINDAFLVTLFQILTETPQMTATEVIERANEKGILIAPTATRQQTEYLGPTIDRELDLLASFRVLPPMPMALREARGEYQVAYTSPIARAMRAQDAAGFQRVVQFAQEVVNVTQDPSLLDVFDFDYALRDDAQIQAVPEGYMADDKAIAAKRKSRAQAQQQQQQIQALPAQAAMVKAQAVAQKAQAEGGGQPPQGVPQPQPGPQGPQGPGPQ